MIAGVACVAFSLILALLALAMWRYVNDKRMTRQLEKM
jgi:hypothetical protein